METRYPRPELMHSLLTIGSIIGVISAGLFWLTVNLQILLLACIAIAACSACRITHGRLRPVCKAMSTGVQQASGTFHIFILIGTLTAALTQSGTIPTLMYYSLQILSPGTFLPGILIFCSLTSCAIGSSWGTVAILGLALINIGSCANIPAPIIAGAIVSGASFGEKISPASAATNFVAASSHVDLYKHIKSMMYTTIPTYIIVLIIYSAIGIQYANNTLYSNNINNIADVLSLNYHISVICLLPVIIMIMSNAYRISPELSIITAIVSAAVISYFMQGNSIANITCVMLHGEKAHSNAESLNKLFSAGGVLSVTAILSISLLALMLGGILQFFGFIQVLIESLIKKVKRAGTLVTITIASCFFCNISMGEAYISVILGGKAFADIYNRHGINKAVLSRSLEEGAILTTSIIPWTTGGIFISCAMSISVISYLPWALLNWLNPLISILFAFFGIALWNNQKVNHLGYDENTITSRSQKTLSRF